MPNVDVVGTTGDMCANGCCAVRQAGFLENFVMNCTILNNVFAFVNENEFWPGSDFSGQTCFPNTGAAIYAPDAGSWNGEPCRRSFMKPCFSAFNFSRNILYWRHGQLFGGGSGLLSSSWSNNLYLFCSAQHTHVWMQSDGYVFECCATFR